MSVLMIVLLVLLILAVVGGFPAWGYHTYGWYPSGIIGLLLVIFLILLLTGHLGRI
jgi:hypothetical protein